MYIGSAETASFRGIAARPMRSGWGRHDAIDSKVSVTAVQGRLGLNRSDAPAAAPGKDRCGASTVFVRVHGNSVTEIPVGPVHAGIIGPT